MQDYTSGTNPNKADTKRQLLVKILIRLGILTGDKANYPLDTDSDRILLIKILKTLNNKWAKITLAGRYPNQQKANGNCWF